MSKSLTIAKLFKAGMSRAQIREALGISLKKIDSALRRYAKPGGHYA